jgi:hypothetical protein
MDCSSGRLRILFRVLLCNPPELDSDQPDIQLEIEDGVSISIARPEKTYGVGAVGLAGSDDGRKSELEDEDGEASKPDLLRLTPILATIIICAGS